MADPTRPPYLWTTITIAVFGLLASLVAWRLTPPEVCAESCPANAFSAARAREIMARIFEADTPHATGTPARARTAQRLRDELEKLGLKSEIQSGAACNLEGICAELHNVVARVPGTNPGWELVLSAHYDSVAAGPGAGDDGQGVASLIEIARALRTAPLNRGVLLLFTDGEELGMLGARLFVSEHPLGADPHVVLNLEARGNRGPSLMFEASAGSAWLISHFAAAPRPVSSSLFGAVYRTLPNDTDLTIFMDGGWQGLNFAFVGGVENYHTPGDTSHRLDFRSVQQQGDAALATIRSLVEHGSEPPGGEAIFFDLLATLLVRIPAPLFLPVVPLPLIVFGACVVVGARRDGQYRRELGRAAVGFITSLALPAALAAFLGFCLTLLGALPSPILATSWPLLAALVGLILAGQAAAHQILGPPNTPAFFDVTWLTWASVGLALSVRLPPASYVATVPALIAAVLRGMCLLRSRQHRLPEGWMLVAALASGLLWLPALLLLPGTVGLGSPLVLSLAFGFGASPLSPLLAPLLRTRGSFGVLLGSSLALGASQWLWPPYSPEVPRRLPIVLEVEASGRAHWLADAASPLPGALVTAASFAAEPSRPHPWPGFGRALMYAAPARALPAPDLSPRLLQNSPGTLSLSTRLPPEVWALGLVMPPQTRLAGARWRGRSVPTARGRHTQRLLIVPGDDREVQLELSFESEVPERLELLAIGLGLPGDAEPLLAARGSAAVSSGFGDLTMIRIETSASD